MLSIIMGQSCALSFVSSKLIIAPHRFYCEGRTLTAYTVTTLASAIAGSYLPFQKWFNERQNKVSSIRNLFPGRDLTTELRYQGWRIAFFLGISFTAIAPLSHLAYAHGIRTMMRFAGVCKGGFAQLAIRLTVFDHNQHPSSPPSRPTSQA